jgi:hypothetical protein
VYLRTFQVFYFSSLVTEHRHVQVFLDNMSNQLTDDEENENPSLSSTLRTTQRASQSQLLTKIYYPDTLYPDNYSFFADRGDTKSSQVKSPPPPSMDTSDQYPITSIDSTGPPIILSTIPKQATTESGIIDRQSKYSVSDTGFFLFTFYFIVTYTFIPSFHSIFFSAS